MAFAKHGCSMDGRGRWNSLWFLAREHRLFSASVSGSCLPFTLWRLLGLVGDGGFFVDFHHGSGLASFLLMADLARVVFLLLHFLVEIVVHTWGMQPGSACIALVRAGVLAVVKFGAGLVRR